MRAFRLLAAAAPLLLLPAPAHPAGAGSAVSVDFSRPVGALDPQLWSSSGLAQDLATGVFDQDMQLAGSVPHEGRSWMRPHDLLGLVAARGWESGRPDYDWRGLDRALDTMIQAGLTPLFELMGNPSKHFTSFLEREQLLVWKRLVRDLALHLEERYGRAEVRAWLFESWNEPDTGYGWKWRSPAEHQNYYDACSEGLKEADPALRFGGPGVTRHQVPYGPFLRSFLEHCDSGTNYFTGERGVRLDFISYHCKNLPAAMVDAEVANLNALLRDHPALAGRPVLNDEADSESEWLRKDRPQRATPWYAAFVARSVHEHLVRMVDGRDVAGGLKVDYRLSNDDAFWGPWIYRTQFAHFGDESRFALVKKPSHSVRAALALLGGVRCEVAGPSLGDEIGAVATLRGREQAAVLLYRYRDQPGKDGPAPVRLALSRLPFAGGRVAVYRIDADHGDTHALWERMGSPAAPSAEQLAALRSGQELAACEPTRDVAGDSLELTVGLPLPGVCVVVVSRDPGSGAGRIEGLGAEDYPSLSGDGGDLLLRWRSFSPFVRTYEVLYGAGDAGAFTRVSAAEQIGTAFVYRHAAGARGRLKVRAVDYWGRIAAESDPLPLSAATSPCFSPPPHP